MFLKQFGGKATKELIEQYEQSNSVNLGITGIVVKR